MNYKYFHISDGDNSVGVVRLETDLGEVSRDNEKNLELIKKALQGHYDEDIAIKRLLYFRTTEAIEIRFSRGEYPNESVYGELTTIYE